LRRAARVGTLGLPLSQRTAANPQSAISNPHLEMSDLPLLSLAVLLGVCHTLLGPDHYLPFVAMSRVGNWSRRKTVWITLLCGIAHVLGSVVLGCVGIALGIAVLKLEPIEEIRGDLAGWLLLTFGLLYFVWGLARALRNRPHVHVHADGTVHAHPESEHSHELGQQPARGPMTPWVLFTIFLFGPCEPLIPVLMYPAARGSAWSVALVSGLFGLATLGTMLSVVLVMCRGADLLPLGRLERYSHALAGLVVLSCGLAIKLGL
jgi:sulfite exporter TauE/SafE